MSDKSTLRDKWEELKKAMKQGGLGGAGSVKAGAVLPSINKLPKPGNNSATPSIGKAPASKKNPIKSAEQTQNKDIKDLKMKEAQATLKAKVPEMIKFEKNGQWSIAKKETASTMSYDDGPDSVIDGATINQVEDRGSDVNIASVSRPGASVKKSGYKGYSESDNARRKARNLSIKTGVKNMPRVKEYGNSASVQATRQAAKDKAKSKKNPVNIMTGDDIPQEIRDKYGKKNRS